MSNWGWKKGFQKFSHDLVFELSNSKLLKGDSNWLDLAQVN